jgi:hypothetical protein
MTGADHSVQAHAVLGSGDGHAQDIDLRGREVNVAGERGQAGIVGRLCREAGCLERTSSIRSSTRPTGVFLEAGFDAGAAREA